MTFPADRIQEIHDKHFPAFDPNAHDRFLQEVAGEFGWTMQEAYLATDHLFRPPNMN